MQALETTAGGRAQLRLLAFRGFKPEAAAFWDYVSATGKSTCAMCLNTRERVFVSDVERSEILAASEDQSMYLAAGIRSVQTTPLISGRGRLVGMLSTHWATRHEPMDRELRNLDILARLTADLIEQRLAEQELREADRRKDEFLATLAHELRNPLAPVRTGIHLLRVGPADPALHRRITDTMERQITHIVRLVDDLLELSRVSLGRIELQKQVVTLTSLVRRGVETMGPVIEAAGHRLAINLPAEPVWLDVDPVRLSQVIGNLLNNAAKYTESRGAITLEGAVSGDCVSVSVRDTGAGIPAEMLPRVFDLFTQVDRTLGHAQGGLGIGLALVKHLVEMHGGGVEAHSDGPGRGSEFVIRLPIVSAPRAEHAHSGGRADTSSRAATGQRCLVCDDNRDAADMLTMVLQLMGADVRTTYDGGTVLAQARAWRPSVVFLDLGMPGLDGYAVAAQIRAEQQFKATTLVAVSGWGQAEDRRRTQEVGFDAHFVKPVATAAVAALLESLRLKPDGLARHQTSSSKRAAGKKQRVN